MLTRSRVCALTVVLISGGFLACAQPPGESGVPTPTATAAPAQTPVLLPQETRLSNVQQLTFDGENAEAYFSPDGKRISFQSNVAHKCDQIYSMNIDGTDRKLVSTGDGRTTCAFYTPDGSAIVYASTHLGGKECPPVPDPTAGYVWPIYDTYDIFKVNADGTNLTQLTKTKGYDLLDGAGRFRREAPDPRPWS